MATDTEKQANPKTNARTTQTTAFDKLGPKKPNLEKLAAEYAEARDQRIKWLQDEVALKGRLFTAMEKAELKEYRCRDSDNLIEVTEKEPSIRVKTVAEPE